MRNQRVLKLVQLGILTAILLIMFQTPLGLGLKIGMVEITFMTVPVVIGSILLGPWAGAFLGLVFGLLSLSTTPGNPLFGIVFSENIWLLIVVCIVPRVLIGFSSYGVYSLFKKRWQKLSFALAGLVGALTNTVLFLGCVILLLEGLVGPKMAELGIVKGYSAFWVGIGLVNGLPEAAASVLVVTAVMMALKSRLKKQG